MAKTGLKPGDFDQIEICEAFPAEVLANVRVGIADRSGFFDEGVAMKLSQPLESMFIGKGSYTDMGDRYPVLDKDGQSNIKGLYVVGDIAGTPDIKAAINSGFELAAHLVSLPRQVVCDWRGRASPRRSCRD